MANSGKIRLLLVFVFASLFVTAIVIQTTYKAGINLQKTGFKLQQNIQKKEALVTRIVNSRSSFDSLKTINEQPGYALKVIKQLTSDNSVWFITTKNNKLTFWSGVKVIPDNTSALKDGNAFLTEKNGFYEVIKKTDGNFSAIFFILIKNNYAIENQYLQNNFTANLTTDRNITIASPGDKNVCKIFGSRNNYLFSIKAKTAEVNYSFFYFELFFWLLALIVLCILVQGCCSYLANKGYVWASIFALACFIVAFRFINIHYYLPNFSIRPEIFNPDLYSPNYVYPSLGDFCINILCFVWLCSFAFMQRRRLIKKTPGIVVGYVIFFLTLATLIITSALLLQLFYGLVINSKINFDVSNVLNLSGFSMLGILMLCFTFLIFYLLTEIFLSIAFSLNIPLSQKSVIFIAAVLLITAAALLKGNFSTVYLLYALIVLIRGYAYAYYSGRLYSGTFALIVLVCALIASLKLYNFEVIKQQASQKAFIRQLEIPDDPAADVLFKKVEQHIIDDPDIANYATDTLNHDDFIKNRLQKLYFNGYLSKYELKVYEFGDHQQPFSSDKSFSLNMFRDMVLYSAFKVSRYFYHENASFGSQHYFAILPVINKEDKHGTVVIDLKSRPQEAVSSFPGLLVDGRSNQDDNFKNYSYAFYQDDTLVTQSGKFVYDLVNSSLQGRLARYTVKKTKDTGGSWYLRFISYNHLIFRPTKRNVIVVSHEENPAFFKLTAVTFFFAILLAFGMAIIAFRWLYVRARIFVLRKEHPGWNFRSSLSFVLYKTRIQVSIITTVVITLLMAGVITFLSITTQYQAQQDTQIRDKITRVAAAFETGPLRNSLSNFNEENQVAFNNFANTYSADLTLYDLDGNELINTQPKIYEIGLQARKMNGRAFIYLSKLHRSEFVNDEKVGNLNYKAAYVPLLNARNEPDAYLQLPYFSNENDYQQRIGSLLNIILNVYALVFIAIGLFSVVIARQITAPLNFIQYNISKTSYDKKNEPIVWKRNDEIGALVKEYNNMIAELERSANKLAQSERESAWREMAKQVAHEIKNPLTPLKLGLQLLDKSWRDKDPKFDQKFERFSKSFVEQIESLSNIASEFSAFARMPDTRLQRLNLFDMLNQAVTIFKHMDNIRIIYAPPKEPFMINADRDQLLRCFNNLLKNAIEASADGSGGIIDINYLISNGNILLTIKDNGKGIPEHMREKIFEPNFTTKSSGTGLGLAFVKNSIENAGGKVWFETRLEEGTTFYINLPGA